MRILIRKAIALAHTHTGCNKHMYTQTQTLDNIE